jgi:UDP-N-acetylmuramoyl-tripeptide--D-alanyl-D-alanine ligase
MKNFAKQYLTKIFTAQMRKIIARHQPKIINVVGSVGKTTTKMAIATVLKESFWVQVQQGNYNAPISVPFIFLNRSLPSLYNPLAWAMAWLHGQKVLHSSKFYEIVVVELGTDTPGDLAVFKKIIKPDISVVTAISEEHMENFADLSAVAKEELSIASFSKKLVINSDDVDSNYVKDYVKKSVVAITYGQDKSDYNYTLKHNDDKTLTININLKNNVVLEAKTPVVAKQIAKSIAAAITVADLLDVDLDQITSGVAKVTPMSGRMQLLKGTKNSTIIDDSYNASPLAVRAALQTLYEIDAPQKIAILGMMNELGEYSRPAHEAVGELCNPDQLNLVVTLGADANDYLAPVAEAKGCQVIRCNSPYEAGKIVAEKTQLGALILVKGSQNGVFAEEAIKLFLADKQDARLLVRQSSFWLSKKSRQFKT